MVHGSKFIVHRSLFIVDCSSFIVHSSLFIVHSSWFIVYGSLFKVPHWLYPFGAPEGNVLKWGDVSDPEGVGEGRKAD
jgi:hypothetical protein